MKRFLLSLTLLMCAPLLIAGKPNHPGKKAATLPTSTNNRLLCSVAAKTGHLEIVKNLVEKGLVTRETINYSLASALAYNQRTLVIEYLLENGAVYRRQS